MPKVEAPITGGKLSTSDLSGSGKSIAMAVGGVALLTVVWQYGSRLGNWATTQTDQIAGTNASGNAGFNDFGEVL